MTTIKLLQDPGYAPNCFIVARKEVDETFDLHNEKNTILIQIDWDYPALARHFGGSFNDDQVREAKVWLCKNIGAEIEDPGYFTFHDRYGPEKIYV